jgi:hypothetical protein
MSSAETLREAYASACEQCPGSGYLWAQYLSFEISQYASDKIQMVWESIYASSLDPSYKLKLGKRYQDYLMENHCLSEMIRVNVQLSLVSRYVDEDDTISKKSKKRTYSEDSAVSGKQQKTASATS